MKQEKIDWNDTVINNYRLYLTIRRFNTITKDKYAIMIIYPSNECPKISQRFINKVGHYIMDNPTYSASEAEPGRSVQYYDLLKLMEEKP